VKRVLLAVAAAGLLITTAHADSRQDYILHCRGCHGPDGAGAAGAVPSFRGEMARFLQVEGGREYLVRVPGTAQSELSDARIASLLNWMLYEFSPAQIPPDFRPYTEEEVARLRRPLVDVAAMRARLFAQFDGVGGQGPGVGASSTGP